jgi:transposase InsO family protein
VRAADLVNRQFAAGAPNLLWVADFTYAWCAGNRPPDTNMRSLDGGDRVAGPRAERLGHDRESFAGDGRAVPGESELS